MDHAIRCLIVDDEKNAHYVLQNYIQKYSGLVLKGQYYDAVAAINFLKEGAADLVFLDINMPGKDGFELMDSLAAPPKIILTTAYTDFALKAFDYGVLDYLVKPIPYPRFEQAIQRYLSHTAPVPEAPLQENFITLKTDEGMIDFPLDQIIYLQSWGNYIKLHTSNRTFLCTATTIEVERRLPKTEFIRIHKSYIVATGYIRSFNVDVVSLHALDMILPVGITYRRILNEIFRS